MAYVPGAAFVAGTAIASADVDTKLDNMQKYINGDVIAADLAAASIEQKHIARGHYNPVANRIQLVSGVSGGFHSKQVERSFIMSAPTQRNDPDSPTDMPIQNTAVSFYLEQPARVLFQYTATAIFPPVGKTLDPDSLARAYIYVDGVRLDYTEMLTRREILDPGAFPILNNNPYEPYRAGWSGFWTGPTGGTLSQGWHHIGLRGRCFGHYVVLWSWGVSLEGYYV
jgi:hypothetical protein